MKTAKIEKVARTTYDGFYLVRRQGDEIAYAFEGYALCPKDVQAYIDSHEIPEIDAFNTEAIAYGRF